MKSKLNARIGIPTTFPSTLLVGLWLAGVSATVRGEELDTHQQCDPAPAEWNASPVTLPASIPGIIAYEPARDWADRMAARSGDAFYSALYFLPETSEAFRQVIGEDRDEHWVGFDQTYWPDYDEKARRALRHACAEGMEAAPEGSTRRETGRRRVERWILARNQILSMAHLDREELITIAYLLPETTDAFDWIFEQRPELRRGTTDPRIIGETLTSAESEYFLGLLFNEMSRLSEAGLQHYLLNFHQEFKKFYPGQVRGAVSEAGLDGERKAGTVTS